MIRILLADDHGIVRAGLRKIIEESGEMAVRDEVADGKTAVQRASENRPDVAVIDISMPGYDGLEVTKRLTDLYPDLPVIILTMHDEQQYLFRALEAGAMGYLTKSSAPEQLVSSIKRVVSGKRFLTEEGAEAMALKFAKGPVHKEGIDQLSTRELQVLRRLAMGYTNKEIAKAYNISVKTVDTYRHRILKKLNLRNNAELSRFAIRNRLIES
ncbi:MAG: response regulator transcription factor [Desulfarculaceae bacterium]|nr:response regulator transcription factor [Desulfarculaceae bacterium]